MRAIKTQKISSKLYQALIITISIAVILTYITASVCISLKNTKTQEKKLISEVEQLVVGGTVDLEDLELRVANRYRHIVVIKDADIVYDGGDRNTGISSDDIDINEQYEIRMALQDGSAVNSYIEKSILKKDISVAVATEDGYIICLSDTVDTAFKLMIYALPVLAILLILIFVSIFIAESISRSVAKDISMIEFDDPEKTCVYKELLPIAGRMKEHNEKTKEMLESLQIEHDKQDTMRREFTANVSHELKTPLTSISGYAEIIGNGIVKDEDVPRFAGKIYEESQRLITLVGDIIKLSQLDDKEIDVKFEDIDLYDMCSAVLSHLEMAASKRGIKLSLGGDHIKIHSAEQIVEEMIFNICDNAIKYNKENGSVTVFVRQYIDGAEVSVADTGIGIEKDDIERIFERFYRVDKSHSKEIGGTGLGLSIVKHGAKFVGGSVSIESEPGNGTTVRLLF